MTEFEYSPYLYDFSHSLVFLRENTKSGKCAGFQPTIRYFLNDSTVVNLFGAEISPQLLDLLEIALACYLADRVSPRDPKRHSNSNWIRVMKLRIGVRSVEFWHNVEIQDNLKGLLNFLTDDDWQIDFVPLLGKDRLFESQLQLALKPISPPRVALFSGGLDSFSGAANMMAIDRDSDFVLVSGATNYRQISKQRKQIECLKRLERPGGIAHALVEFGIKWEGSDDAKQEKSQRTRGLLFVMLGCIASVNAGSNILEIYENGIGAINLPFDSSQISAMNSKSVHPTTLVYIEQLISSVIGCEFEIRNDFLFSTKGEMCKSLRDEVLGGIRDTFSCDGFPVRVSGKPQCGVCTSCLLRRVSLEAAGLNRYEDGDGYGMDLANIDSNPSLNQLNALRAMEWHFEILRNCLESGNTWEKLTANFPEIATLVAHLANRRQIEPTLLQRNICRLFQSFFNEWMEYSARRHLVRLKRRAA